MKGFASAVFCAVVAFVSSGATQSFVSTSLPPPSPSYPPSSSSPSHNLDHRLPYDISVERYWILLRPYLEETDGDRRFTFDGRMSANLSVDSSTDQILFNVKNLNISEISVCNEACSVIVGWKLEAEYERLVVPLNTTVANGTKMELRVNYVGFLNDELTGFYRSRYNQDGKTKYIATTQMESSGARQAFPCMDEPDRKSVFAIEIRCNKKYTATSNQPLKAFSPTADANGSDTRLFQFEETVKMSTYLVAFIVHDFPKTPAPSGIARIPVQVWGRSKDLSYAATTAAKVLTFYEDFFKIPYPLLNLEMAAIPDFDAGAMENWGLVTYRETALEYNPNSIGNISKIWTTIVISHELAHQWFGNLVTMKWWDDLWLNEAFAECIEFVGLEHILPEVPTASLFQKMELHVAFRIDGLVSSHPVFQEVKSPADVDSIFDVITYQKGSSLLRMLRGLLGQSTFQKGLQRYLKKYKYSNAVGRNLWEELQEQATINNQNIDVPEIMNRWIMQAGYPVVHVTADESAGIKISQSRFFFNTYANTNSNEEKWDIPLTLSTQKHPQNDATKAKVIWLYSNASSLILPDVDVEGWLLVNVDQIGYYRVNYDDSMWRRLTQPSVLKLLSPANRAQLIDDAMDMARGGVVSYDVAFDVFIAIMEREENFYVWDAANDAAKYIQLRLGDSTAKSNLTQMLGRFGAKIFQTMLNRNDDDWNTALLRPLMYKIQCKAKSELCLKSVKDSLRGWQNSRTSLTPNIRLTILCEAVKSVSSEVAAAVFQAYKTEENQVIAEDLRRASTCSKDAQFLTMLINESFSNGIIRKQDAGTTLKFIVSNPVGKQLFLNYTRDNWDLAVHFLGTRRMGTLMKDIADILDDEETLKLLESHVAKVNVQGAALLPYKQSLEMISLNIAWKKTHFDEVVHLLQKKSRRHLLQEKTRHHFLQEKSRRHLLQKKSRRHLLQKKSRRYFRLISFS